MRFRSKLVLVVSLALLAAGCKSGGVKEDPLMALSAEEALTEGKALMELGKYRRAQEYLTHAFEIEPNSASGREGLLLAADALFLDGGTTNFIKAESKYRDFLNRFPTSDQAPYVQFQMANCLIKRMRKPDRDQSISLQALAALHEVLQLYPDSEYAGEAREQIVLVRQNLAEHEFVVGYFNYRFKLYPAAVERFRTVLEEYPETTGLDRALFHLGMAQLKLNAWGEAAAAFDRLRAEYPDSPFVQKVPQDRLDAGAAEQPEEPVE
ncbi:MAG: outer membrane protein assembly factor BamD, partial [Thermoanaerobaculia bacterium]